MNKFPFHVGDYAKHTVHLSNAQDLAYRRALDLYYDTEIPLKTDIPWLSHRLRVGLEDIEFVLREFFVLTPDGYRNKRADDEIAKYHGFLCKQKINGKQGGRPSKKPMGYFGKPNTNPSETQKNPNHKPITINQEPISTEINSETFAQPQNLRSDGVSEKLSVVSALDLDFLEWYMAYPRKVGKGQARRAYTAARKKTDHAALLAGAKRYADDPLRKPEFTKHPSTWLNAECWADETVGRLNGGQEKRKGVNGASAGRRAPTTPMFEAEPEFGANVVGAK